MEEGGLKKRRRPRMLKWMLELHMIGLCELALESVFAWLAAAPAEDGDAI